MIKSDLYIVMIREKCYLYRLLIVKFNTGRTNLYA